MKKKIGDLTLNELRTMCKRGIKEGHTFCIDSNCALYNICELCFEALRDKEYDEDLNQEIEVEEND